MFFIRFVKVISLAFHSKEFYQDLYYNVKGIKFGYLFFILAVSNLVIVSFSTLSIASLFDVSTSSSRGSLIVDQIPLMRMDKGTLSIQSKLSVAEIRDYNNKIAVIDINSFPDKYLNSGVPLFINKSSVFISNGAGGYYKILDFVTYFSDDAILDKSFFIQMFKQLKLSLPFSAFFIFYPLGLLFRCLFLSANLAMLSFFGFIYGKFSGTKLYFKNLFRVSIFSSFPSLLVDFIIICYLFISNRFFFDFYYKIHSPMKENFVFILSVGYFFFAVKSICNAENTKRSKLN
ncbi:MAG: DUF1189 family protein [Alphaproteobacteria bacterium]|nr:DUF1189 family protein [Alphaproteobacteria bacterium]